ncbi:MAG TPA: hypothetical protein VEG44_08015 [Candidatus Acidoferrales bacterium]|nr:hypothetical protein [Candidatus Acidoferrales bacterium]
MSISRIIRFVSLQAQDVRDSYAQDKIKIKLSGVSKTLLIPLWGRTQLSKKHSSLINDTKAIEIVERIDYDFLTFDYDFSTFGIIPFESDLPLLLVLKAKRFDDEIKAYIAEHPHASIVNIGAYLTRRFIASITGRSSGMTLTFLLSSNLENC